jgi:hypothetical protein
MYMMIFTCTMVFTILEIALRKAEWAILANILWWALAIINIGLAADPLFYDISWLFFIIGCMFLVFCFRDIFLSFSVRREDHEDFVWYED